jgi:hypothetical protein
MGLLSILDRLIPPLTRDAMIVPGFPALFQDFKKKLYSLWRGRREHSDSDFGHGADLRRSSGSRRFRGRTRRSPGCRIELEAEKKHKAVTCGSM